MRSQMEITPQELAELLKSGQPLFLADVREIDEFDICRIQGSRIFPLSQFQDVAQDIPKDAPIVTICHHGVRSLNAAAYLKQQLGYTDVKSLAGGIDRWSREIDPKVPRY